MGVRRMVGWTVAVGAFLAAPALMEPVARGGLEPALIAQQPAAAEVTFAKDIAPILQRSCQNCHRPAGVAPMSLVTYEEVRPWARAIKTRTGVGPRAGVMPPWYVEKNIGIQHYKDDPSLNEEEVAKIAKWVDSGAPLGNPAEMPPARVWADDTAWRIGKPDLIVKTKDVVVKANAPDWWGEIESVPIGLTEDRYIAALEIKEVNDVPTAGNGRHTVGGRFVFHHMIWSTRVLDKVAEREQVTGDEEDSTGWPVHEVGRNPDYFDPRAARASASATGWTSTSSRWKRGNSCTRMRCCRSTPRS